MRTDEQSGNNRFIQKDVYILDQMRGKNENRMRRDFVREGITLTLN